MIKTMFLCFFLPLLSDIDFFDGVFFLELVEYSNFAVSRSGASLPRTPPRTFSPTSHLLAPLAPPCRPLAGCESHDSCPLVCAGSKLNMCPVHHDRPASSLGAAGAPRRPIRSVGLAPSSHRLTIAPRRRTARDSLSGIRRSRAASMLSRHELSRRAFRYACTFRILCRGLWMCVVVVSSRASESVVVCTCVFRTD